MTRWFPIAPGTSLPAAPAVVNGQITATKTVPVWNETVLLAARTKTQVVVTDLPYPLSLLTIVSPIVSSTINSVNKITLVKLSAVDIALAPVTPQVSSGASLTSPSSAVSLTVLDPSVVGGASAAVPPTTLLLNAAPPDNVGPPAIAISVPNTTTTIDAVTPVVTGGASLAVPATDFVFAQRTPLQTGPDKDSSFSSVSLLLHMDGSNDSTTFTDSSSNTFTLTAYGNAKLSTAQKKFGSASGLLDGSGDYVTAPGNTAFNFGTGDFTVEAWVRLSTTASDQIICSYTNSDGTVSGANTGWAVEYNTTVPGFRVFLYNNSNIYVASNSASISTGIWYHVAAVRSGGTLKTYVDGIGGTGVSANVAPNNPTGVVFNLGRWFSSSAQRYANGYIDELRITKGVARYTSDFIPPSVQFPDF